MRAGKASMYLAPRGCVAYRLDEETLSRILGDHGRLARRASEHQMFGPIEPKVAPLFAWPNAFDAMRREQRADLRS